MQSLSWRRGIRRDWTRTPWRGLVAPAAPRARSAPRPGSVLPRWRDDTGAATAEYAITIMAAVGFAGLLVVILRSEEVRSILTDLVRSALSVAS